MDWTPQQNAVFDHVGSLVVHALAGTGKTTTLEEKVRRTTGPRLVLAFNRPIANELKTRLGGVPGAVVKTCNAWGNQIVRDQTGKTFNENYVFDQLKHWYPRARYDFRESARKLVAAAKHTLASIDDLDEVADRFQIAFPRGANRYDVISAAERLLQFSRTPEAPFDFNDQVWLPEVLDLPAPRYPLVFVDELQDLSPAQILLVLRSLREDGQLIAFGDENQAIYRFRGADEEAMARMHLATGANRLPLTVSFRCPTSVVKEAQRFVPSFQAQPGAPEGTVVRLEESGIPALVKPGDFVISRLNAPLIALCLKLLSRDVPAYVVDREFGKQLLDLMEGFNAPSMPVLMDSLNRWEQREVKRLENKNRPPDSARDTAECLRQLVWTSPTLEALNSRVKALFENPGSAVKLMSTHKAKGLENDRVWVLANTYRPWEGGEEQNLYYVALTRSKDRLYIVDETTPSL